MVDASRKIVRRAGWLVLCVGLLVVALLVDWPSRLRGKSGAQLTLAEAIDLSSDYLARHCNDQGRFAYQVFLDSKHDFKPRYNIIRHAGAIYALADSQRRHPSPEKLAALRRAVEFLRRKAIGPLPEHPDMLAVWSGPEEDGKEAPPSAKLGGTGLGLVALLSAKQVGAASVPLEELRGLGRFLVFMQETDGNYYAKYTPGPLERHQLGRSLYYPGEAALGLLMLYEKDPQPIWLDTAAKAMAYLARLRRQADVVEPDHWALLATARLWPVCDECRPPLPRETLSRHAVQICRRMLNDRPWMPSDSPWAGCLTYDGRTCPTATRIEGLAAALTFLPDEHAELRQEIRQAVGPAVDFLRRSQIRHGPYAGGIPGAVASGDPVEPPPKSWGGVSPESEIRVDFVQHAISAMIQWEQLQNENSMSVSSGD